MESDDEFECISVLHKHTQDVKSVLWHPKKEALFSCSYDDTIRIWEDDEDDWYCSNTLEGHTSTVWGMSFDKTGNYLVSCSDDKNLIIWDISSLGKEPPKRVATLSGFHTRTIYSVSWSQSGLIATGAADDCIRIFEQDPNQQFPSFFLSHEEKNAHESDINCVAWNPKYPSLLVSGGDDQVVKIWSYQVT